METAPRSWLPLTSSEHLDLSFSIAPEFEANLLRRPGVRHLRRDGSSDYSLRHHQMVFREIPLAVLSSSWDARKARDRHTKRGNRFKIHWSCSLRRVVARQVPLCYRHQHQCG